MAHRSTITRSFSFVRSMHHGDVTKSLDNGYFNYTHHPACIMPHPKITRGRPCIAQKEREVQETKRPGGLRLQPGRSHPLQSPTRPEPVEAELVHHINLIYNKRVPGQAAGQAGHNGTGRDCHVVCLENLPD